MRITREQIARAERSELVGIRNQLYVEKMKLDKFFSVFLDQAEMEPDETDTPEWKTYKEMLKEYTRVDSLIKSTDYYLR